jgi:hypothetical protein
MSKNVIFVLTYHHHKPLDPIYKIYICTPDCFLENIIALLTNAAGTVTEVGAIKCDSHDTAMGEHLLHSI